MDVKIERGARARGGIRERPTRRLRSSLRPVSDFDRRGPAGSADAFRADAGSGQFAEPAGNAVVVGVRLKRLIPYDTIAVYVRREE